MTVQTVTVGFERVSYTEREDVGQFQVCVMVTVPPLSGTMPPGNARVTATSAIGTAEAGDFTAVNYTATFDEARRRECLAVTITQDAFIENSESFTLTLTPDAGASDFAVAIDAATATATVTIEDDDRLTVEWSADAYTAAEEDGDLTVTLALAVAGDVSIYRDDFSIGVTTHVLSGDTATAGSDFTALLNQSVGPFSDATRTYTVVVPIVDDTLVEPNETFGVVSDFLPGQAVPPNTVLRPRPPAGSGLPGGAGYASVTITDDDTDTAPAFASGESVDDQTYTVRTQIADLTLPEVDAGMPGNGDITYTLTPTGDIPAGLSFDATTRALRGTPSAATTAAVTLTYTAADEDTTTGAADEASLTFAVTVNPATPAVLISQSVLSILEDRQDTYTVELSTAPSGTATVVASIAGTGHDLTLTPSAGTELLFTASTWNTPQTVTVAAAMDSDTDNETATITHSITGYAATTAPSVTVNADEQYRFGFAAEAYTVAEGAGTVAVCVELFTSPPDARLIDVGFLLNSSDDSATAGADYEAQSGAHFVFDAANRQRCADFVILEDTDIESNERFNISLTLSPITRALNAGIVVDPDLARVTITDNDTPAVTVSASALSVAEGGSGNYTVVLATDPGVDATVTVTPSVSSGTVTHGVTVTTGALTFDSSNWSTAQDVSVAAADDVDFDDETATISHAVSDAGTYVSVTADDVVVTVDDDDIADTNGAPAFAGAESVDDQTYTAGTPITALTLPEIATATPGDGDITYTLTPTSDIPTGLVFDDTTRTLSGIPSAAATAVMLTYTAADSDINTDAADEASLTFSVTIEQAPPTVSIARVVDNDPFARSGIDDDTARPGFQVDERDNGSGVGLGVSYDIELNTAPASGEILTVTVEVSGVAGAAGTTSDLTTALSSSVPLASSTFRHTFNPGDTSVRQRLNVRLDDIAEGYEGFTFTITGLSGSAAGDYRISFTERAISGEITPSNLPTVALASPAGAVREGDDAIFGATVTPMTSTTLSGPVTFAARVAGSGGNAADATDYGSPVSTPIPLGETGGDVRLPIVLDGVTEADEELTLTLDEMIFNEGTAAESRAPISPAPSATATLTDPTPGVAISHATLDVGEGATAFYAVALYTAPSGSVIVTPTSGTPAAATVSGALTFTTANWNTRQTVTVTGVADDDAVDATANIMHAVSGVSYAGNTAADVAVTVVDDETASVMISAAYVNESTLLRVDEGGTETYTVVLTSEPVGGDVMVTLSRDPASPGPDLTHSPGTLTFTATAGNWNMPQTITITAAEDDDAVTDPRIPINHAVAGADYDGISAASVRALIVENDSVGVTITPTTLSVDEGVSLSYTVALTSAPSAGVVSVTPSSADFGAVNVITTALVFDDSNWNMPQTVSVGGVADTDAVDESVLISNAVGVSVGSSDYNSASAAGVTVAVNDDGMAAVMVGATTLTIDEDGDGTYTVVLGSAPGGGGDATVTPTSADTDIATVSGALIFTAAAGNWNMPQTVTVTGVADGDDDDATVSITHAVSGYNGIATAAAVTVTVTDDDTVGVNLSVSTLPLIENATATYTVVLGTQPSADVMVTPASADPAVATVSGALTFTVAAWNVPQSVTVTGVDDDNIVANSTNITHTAASTDTEYDDVTVADVAVTVTDGDAPGVVISEPTLTVDEGDSATYTVRLATVPSGEVTITPSSTATANVSGALTFTDGNWNMRQTITVTGVADADATANADASITHAATGADADYNALTAIDSVTVTVDETDMRGVMISTATVDVPEGDSNTYTVELTSAPDGGDVTVTASIPSGNELSFISSGVLTFGVSNWNIAQPVSLTATADADAVADPAIVITHAVAGADYESNNVQAADVTATITESERVGITVSETTLDVNENDFATYTVELDSAPSVGEVTVTPSSGDGGAVTVTPTAALVFDDANWNIQQTVSVRGVPDEDAVDETVVISNAVTVSDGLSDYTGATAASVTVTVDDSGTASVTIGTPALTVAENGDATYTIVLTSAPSGGGDATVTPASADTDIAIVSGALTFSDTNWNMTQDVTVSGVEDLDADDEMVSITHTVSGYNGITTADAVAVTVTDTNDTGVTLSERTLSIMENTNTTYTVVLDTQPSGDVTITPDSGDDDVATVSGALTFTTANWNTAQSVTVTGADDDNGVPDNTSITHTAVSTDANYNGTAISDVTVSVMVTDTDTPGVTISDATLSVEEGAVDTYTVRLTTQPTANVVITPSSDNASATVSGPLTFTATNWSDLQTVTVTGAMDADANANADAVISHVAAGAAEYDGLTPIARVTVTVTETDTRGITLSETALSVTEGGSGNYTVRLNSEPDSDVVITPTSADPGAAGVSAALVFTTANWNTAQTVIVTGVEDDDATNESAQITHAASGSADYAAVDLTAETVTVTVTDNDTRGVTLLGTPVNVLEGATVNYGVVLDTPPTGDVMVTPSSAAATVATVSPTGGLVFTTANWNIPQSVTVTGVEDANTAVDTTTITHAVTGADYDGITVAADPVVVTVTDNDMPGVMISTAALAIDEGRDNTYTVVLNTQPSGAVAVALSIDGDVTADATTLNFTVSNWNTAQTVTISAAEDFDGNDDIASITHTVSGGGYDGASITNDVVTVTVTDNDPRGIMLSVNTLSVGENATANYTVELATEPNGNVTITPTSADPAAATVSAALTFTTANWNTAQQVVVTGVADDDASNEMFAITHAASGSADYAAVDLTAETVTVTVTDNNTRDITLSGTIPVTVAEGATANYGVVLDTQPSGDVTVTPTSDTPAVATVSAALVFGPSNWNTVQNVVVTGVEDANTEDDSASITHAVTGADYAGVTLANVAVTVTDNDMPGVTISTATLTIGEDTSSGAGNTYTVVLNTEPSGDVTVMLDSNNDDVTTNAATLNFGAGNWNTPQDVIVSAAEDNDATDDTAGITHTVSGSNYAGAAISPNAVVTVTVTDNGTREVTIAPTSVNVTEGTSDTFYTVVLTSAPDGGDVMVTPSGIAGSDLMLHPSGALTFDDGNWNRPQTVSVEATADDDAVTDADIVIAHAVTGADYEINNVPAADVTVTITEVDTPGVRISTGALSVAEGGNNTYTVRLNTQPSGDVAVALTIDNSDVTADATTLNFGIGNWNTAQTVTLSAAEDFDGNDDNANITHTVSGADYAGAAISNNPVVVTVTDNDMPGVTLSAAPVMVTEGASVNYGVVLNTQPSGDVMVTPSSAAVAIATVSGPLTFTTANWNTVQSVIVTGAEDSNTETDNTSITHAVTGADYASVNAADVAVTVNDNDTQGVTISTGTRAIDEGTSSGADNTYNVVLNTEPSGDVTVALSSDNTEVTLSAATLNFTVANWNTAQNVVVSAAEDADATDETAAITHTVSGSNYATAPINNNPVVVTVTDNDTPGVTVSRSTLAMDEEGYAAYTVVLTAAPTSGDVMVAASVTPNDVVTLNPGVALVFDDTTWNTAQTVQVSAHQDSDGNDERATITHAATGEAEYEGIDIDPVVVTVTDDDTPGVTISETSLTVNESGGNATYTVKLETQPSGNVPVTPANGNTAATLSPGGPLTFTNANWNTAQTITVTGGDIPGADDITGNITHTLSGYGGVTTAAAVAVRVRAAGIVLRNSEGDEVTQLNFDESNDTAYYTVELDTVPTARVTVTPQGDVSAVTIRTGARVFTRTNWNVRQTVNITVGASTDIRHIVSATGNYAGLVGPVLSVVFDSAEAVDSVNAVILPEVTRVIVGHHLNAITNRIARARTATGGVSGGGLRANLGGHSTLEELAATHAQTMVNDDFDTKTLLSGSDFAMPLNADGVGGLGGSNLALWGSGDYRDIGGDSNNVDWDGSLFSAHLGVDAYLSPGLLAGAMLSWSEADLEYTNRNTATATSGDYTLDITSIHPYIGWHAPDGRLDLWATVGWGAGELEITETNDDQSKTGNATLQTVGIGGSARLAGGFNTELRLKGEVQQTRLEVEQAEDGGFNEMGVDASQARLAIEATRTVTTRNGAQVSPSLELGARYDGGDGETGGGMEIGAGLRYHNATRGLTVETRMRALLSHSNETEDKGISVTLNLTSGADRQGLSLSLTPAYGNLTSGVQNVWNKGLLDSAATDRDLSARMTTELAYGLTTSKGLLTPYTKMTLGKESKTYRLGVRWELGGMFTLNLAGERLERDDAVVEDVYLLEGEVEF